MKASGRSVILGITFACTILASALTPQPTWAAADQIPCDPAIGCVPVTSPQAPPSPPPPPAPAPSPPPVAAPAPVGDLPARVRIVSATVRKGDADSLNANGFAVRVKWSGGLRASTFTVRLQTVSFRPVGPGDTAKGSRFVKLKPGDWVDTQRTQPKTWTFSVPRVTQFYRVQVRAVNSLGPGPVAEQYLLVTKHNEGAIVFKPGT